MLWKVVDICDILFLSYSHGVEKMAHVAEKHLNAAPCWLRFRKRHSSCIVSFLS